MAIEPGAVFAFESGIVLHSLPDRNWYYAFNIITGDHFRLNQTSFWVLENISDGVEWTVLRGSFLETFEVPAAEGETDLKQLLEELREQGIIKEGQQ